MTLVMLKEVNIEVDWWVDNCEEVGEVGGVLHPGGPHKVLLDKENNHIYHLVLSTYLAWSSLLHLKYVRYPADAVAHNEH